MDEATRIAPVGAAMALNGRRSPKAAERMRYGAARGGRRRLDRESLKRTFSTLAS